MALSATIFKAEADVSDIDRQHYAHYSLTLARHPSETSERMMVRLLAFLHQADGQLVFTKGLSDNSEPDLWLKDYTGGLLQWIEVGMPDEKRVAQACGRAGRVTVYAYGRQALRWWQQMEKPAGRFNNLSIYCLPVSTTQALAELATRSMHVQAVIEHSQMMLTFDDGMIEVDWSDALMKKGV